MERNEISTGRAAHAEMCFSCKILIGGCPEPAEDYFQMQFCLRSPGLSVEAPEHGENPAPLREFS